MDSFELNKIIGAVLGTLLFIMGVGFIAEAIYEPIEGAGPGYALAGQAEALCLRIAAGPPLALAASKRSLQRAMSTDLQSQIEWEAAAQAALGKSQDVREGIAAFFERRAASFTGK